MTQVPAACFMRGALLGSKSIATAILLGVIAALAACGGSNSSSAPQLVSIAVTPATVTIGIGSTQQFTAIGTYTDNSTQNLTTTVVWSSSSEVASINNSSGSQGLAIAISLGFTSITATLSGVRSSAVTLTTPEYAYVANDLDSTVAAFSIDTGGTPGTLTLIGTVGTGGTNARSVTVDPTGHYAYVANGTVSAFSIGADGALTLIGTVVTGGGSNSNPDSVTVDPTARYAYVANYGNGSVSAFAIAADGTLTLIGTVMTGSGGPSANNSLGSEPSSVTVDPAGHYAYVANQTDGTVSAFSIGTDGTLTLIGTAVTGSGPHSFPLSVNVDPMDHYAYVANSGDGTVSAFSIGTDGTLTLIGTVMTGSGATSGPISVTTAF